MVSAWSSAVAFGPFANVAADGVYGTGDIKIMLRKAGKRYVLGVADKLDGLGCCGRGEKPRTLLSRSWSDALSA
jgi:hypothetical protein